MVDNHENLLAYARELLTDKLEIKDLYEVFGLISDAWMDGYDTAKKQEKERRERYDN